MQKQLAQVVNFTIEERKKKLEDLIQLIRLIGVNEPKLTEHAMLNYADEKKSWESLNPVNPDSDDETALIL